MRNSRILPPVYFLAALVINLALHFFLPVKILISTPWRLLGLFPVTVGVIMNLMANRKFHLAGTTVRPFEVSSRLLTDGLFRISRNPMYLGFILIVSGETLLLGSLAPILITMLLAVLLDRRFVVAEEQMLATRFGDEWRTYAATTRRWI